jgi:hypothetical protein
MILLSGYELQVPPFMVFAGRLLLVAVVKAPGNSIPFFGENIRLNSNKLVMSNITKIFQNSLARKFEI